MLRRFRCVHIFLKLYKAYSDVLGTVAFALVPASKRLLWFYRHGCSECGTRTLGRDGTEMPYPVYYTVLPENASLSYYKYSFFR